MPRYLGLNYLSAVTNAKKSLLLSNLMIVPNHLYAIDHYAHLGANGLEYDVYRRPWLNVNKEPDKTVDVCSNLNANELQRLYSVLACVDFEDFNKVFTYDDEFNSKLCIQADSECKSSSTWDSIFENEIDDSPLLEETIILDNYRVYRAYLPAVSRLLLRLKCEIVEDPFVETNFTSINFMDKRPLTLAEDLARSFIIQWKKCVLESPTGLLRLEDVIVNDEFPGKNFEFRKFSSNLVKVLSASSEDICLSDGDEDFINLNTSFVQQSFENFSDDVSRPRLYNPVEDSPNDQSADVTSFNELEPPVASIKQYTTLRWYSKPWSDLCIDEEIEQQLLDGMISQLICESKDLIKSYRSENYIDELDSLTLAEPVTPNHRIELLNRTRTHSVIAHLGLSVDNKVVDIELKLPWDPLSVNLSNAACFQEIDRHFIDVTVVHSNPDDGSKHLLDIEPIKWYPESPIVKSQSTLVKSQFISCADAAKSELGASAVYGVDPYNYDGTSRSKVRSNGEDGTWSFSGNLDQSTDVDSFSRFLSFRQHGSGAHLTCVQPNPKFDEEIKRTGAVYNSTNDDVTNRTVQWELVKIPLSDAYHHVIDLLELYAKPALTQLFQHKLISTASSTSLLALPADVARFTFKQVQLSSKETQGELLQSAAVIYLLSCTANLVYHSCLHTAILQLSLLYDELSHIVTNSVKLDELRRRLYVIHCQHKKTKTVHPKVLRVCKILSKWIEANKDGKALIIIKKGLLNTAEHLLETISTITDIDVYPLFDVIDISDCLKRCNCVISVRQLSSDCQWSHFSLVVDYDYTPDFIEASSSSSLQQYSSKNSLKPCKFIGLQSVLRTSNDQMYCVEMSDNYSSADCGSNLVIVSQNITSNATLMCLLETRYNLTLVDRNYEKLTVASSESSKKPDRLIHFEDIAIDAVTCVVLEDISRLSDKRFAHHVLVKVAALSAKFENCWVILHHHETKSADTNCNLFSDVVLNNAAKLQATLAVLDDKMNDYNTKVLICQSNEATAATIAKITLNRRGGDHMNLNVISRDPTQQERFLLTYPCLNSISAQLMLHSLSVGCSMSTLMIMSATMLADQCPQISAKVIQMFDKINNSSCRLTVDINHKGDDVVDIVDGKALSMNSIDANCQLSSTSIQVKPLKDNSKGKAVADLGSNQCIDAGKLVLIKREYLEDDEGKFLPSSDFIDSFHEYNGKSSMQHDCFSTSYESIASQNVSRNTSFSNDLITGSHYKLRHPKEEAMTKNKSWFPRLHELQSVKHKPLNVETADRVAVGEHFAETVRSQDAITMNKSVWSKMSNAEINPHAIRCPYQNSDQSFQSQIQHSKPGFDYTRSGQYIFSGSSSDCPTSSRLGPVTSDTTYNFSPVNKRGEVRKFLAEKTLTANSCSTNDYTDFVPFKRTHFQSTNKTGVPSPADDVKSSYFLNGKSATYSTRTSEFATTQNHCRMPRRSYPGIRVFDENCANDTKTLPQFSTRKPEIACVMPLIRPAVTLQQKSSRTRVERVTFSIAVHEPSTCVASVSTPVTTAFRETTVSGQTERSSISVLQRRSSLFTTIGPNRSSLTVGLIKDQRCSIQQGGVHTNEDDHLKGEQARQRGYQDSPPLDMGSDDDCLTAGSPGQGWITGHSKHHSTTGSYEESGVSSNKKRKLTFDKDFMLAGGQTRLRFM